MTLLQALVLGVVQGVTEFLPVSSDGHLALTYRAFGMDAADPGLFTYTVFLHGATLLAMVVYFRGDLLALARSLGPKGKGSADRRLLLLLGGATIITGALAFGMKKIVAAANESLLFIGFGFLVTAAVLSAAEVVARRAKDRAPIDPADLSWPRAAGIAVAQALAALPGVSRSGSTIAGGMVAGLDREQAARFSFLLGIPIIAMASGMDALDVLSGASSLPGVVASVAGFAAALASGYAAIWGLLALVKKHSLWWFAGYTALVGAASVALYFAA